MDPKSHRKTLTEAENSRYSRQSATMARCGNAEDLKQTAKERKANAPRSLPLSRPRALTNPLPASSDHYQRTWKLFIIRSSTVHEQRSSDQSRSALCQKLPPEIRKLIWREVVGRKLLHVVRAPRRLLAIKCAKAHRLDSTSKQDRCLGTTSRSIQLGATPGFYLSPRPDSAARVANLLQLLKTCRLIYSEAIRELYTTNIFAFDHLDTLPWLSKTVLPYRLSMIRAISLTWTFKYPMIPITPAPKSPSSKHQGPPPPYDEQTWIDLWGHIARMVGLRRIRVALQNNIVVQAEAIERLMAPLYEIRQADVFVVRMSYLPDVEIEGAPFRLVRQ